MTSSLNILVAGGAGYIGTHMVKALLDAGHNPITLDNLSRGHLELLPGGKFIQGSIEDTILIDKIFLEHEIDAVMHFAAFIEVGESVENPLMYYRNNLTATVSLLESMIKHRVKRFIFSSSAAIYGEPDYTPIDEGHPCNPKNPYGETKLYVEKLMHNCGIAHGLKHISLRYFNASGADPSGVIGESHKPESHLIPLILNTAAGKQDEIKIYGVDYPTPDGTCVRDYIHVDDLVSAHLIALSYLINDGRSNIYNLGNSRGYSVREVIETVRKVTGKNINVVETGRQIGDPAVLVADSQKIRSELGWKPVYEDLEKIVQTAWNWHQK